MLGNDDEAQDAVQDACLRAHKGFANFSGMDGRSWLLKIVRNTCFTMLLNRKRNAGTISLEEELGIPSPEPSPEDELIANADREKVRACIEQLSVELREIIVLREIEGLSYREIANVSDLPIGTVMSRLARARERLRALLTSALKEEVH